MPKIFYRAPSPVKHQFVPTVMKIRSHHPLWCTFIAVLTTIIFIGISGGWFFFVGLVEIPALQSKENPLQLENTRLMVQNQELRQKLAIMVRTAQNDQETYTQVLQTLDHLQAEKYNLTEELTFYQRLLTSPEPLKSSTHKVVVTNFSIDYDEKTGDYPYKLVLTQWAKNAKVKIGLVQIHLVGQVADKTKHLTMKSLTQNAIEAITYKVHYFQRIENSLQIPKAFIPNHLIIRILPENRKMTVEEIRFKWKELQRKEQL